MNLRCPDCQSRQLSAVLCGMPGIERMRAEAEEKLGAAFDEKEFHTFILDMGPAPFTIIRDYFDEWLKTAQKSG